MPLDDLFIGLVAAALGCCLVVGAILDGAWLMRLSRPRLLAETIGKTTARWTIGLIGIGLIVMGGLIASGWRVDWSRFGESRRPRPSLRDGARDSRP